MDLGNCGEDVLCCSDEINFLFFAFTLEGQNVFWSGIYLVVCVVWSYDDLEPNGSWGILTLWWIPRHLHRYQDPGARIHPRARLQELWTRISQPQWPPWRFVERSSQICILLMFPWRFQTFPVAVSRLSYIYPHRHPPQCLRRFTWMWVYTGSVATWPHICLPRSWQRIFFIVWMIVSIVFCWSRGVKCPPSHSLPSNMPILYPIVSRLHSATFILFFFFFFLLSVVTFST